MAGLKFNVSFAYSGSDKMRYVHLNDFRNLVPLEEELKALGKASDFERIKDEAIKKVSMSEGLLEGVINVRKDYEKDSIVCIFHVIKNEDMEMSDNWIAVDIVYHGTTHYS